MKDMFDSARRRKHRRKIHQVDVLEGNVIAMWPDSMVDDRYFMACLYKRIHHVRAYESAASRHCDSWHIKKSSPILDFGFWILDFGLDGTY
jgi:hypothetical protein